MNAGIAKKAKGADSSQSAGAGRILSRGYDVAGGMFGVAGNVAGNALGVATFGILDPLASRLKRRDSRRAFDTEDITALIRYASEQAVDPKLVSDTYHKLIAFERLRNGSELRRSEGGDSDEAEDKALDKANVELLHAYTRLCGATDGVTGNTVVDSAELGPHTRHLLLITFGFLFWALFTVGIGQHLNTEKQEAAQLLSAFHEYFLEVLNPYFWGGLGACVYILKRCYDASREHVFDRAKYDGWSVRVVLGFILGGAVVHIVDALGNGQAGGNESVSFQFQVAGSVMAFLAGLSTKVVYGALEALVLDISRRFNLDSSRRRTNASDTVTRYLTDEIGKLNPASQKDKARYAALTELLRERQP